MKQTVHAPDISLLAAIAVLLVFGVVMVYDSSGKYHLLFLQSLWAVLGAASAFLTYRIGYRALSRFGFALLLLSLVLLFLLAWPNIPLLGELLFIPQSWYDALFPAINGARRWVMIPGLPGFQPSELAKLSLVLYFSLWLAKKQVSAPRFLLIFGLTAALVLLEPDYGTAAIISALSLCMFFVSGANLLKFVPLLLVIAFLAVLFIVASPYRLERLKTFISPESSDPLSSGYHTKQVLIALGSGGMFGLGFGQSRQKYEYIPEVSTDSIFAVVGEELGFAGAFLLVLAYLFAVFRAFLAAQRAPTMEARLLAAGVACWLGVQVLVNLAAMTALGPLTGVPLPLISYGGSSLIFMMAALGLLLSVSKETVKVGK